MDERSAPVLAYAARGPAEARGGAKEGSRVANGQAPTLFYRHGVGLDIPLSAIERVLETGTPFERRMENFHG